MKSIEDSTALVDAMRCLVRREYSAKALREKLLLKGHSELVIEQTMTYLQVQGYQSEERFAMMWVRHRFDGGYGPLVIRSELAQQGIDSAMINEALCQIADWSVSIASHRHKAARKSGAQQWAYWRRRGFSFEMIRLGLDGQCNN